MPFHRFEFHADTVRGFFAPRKPRHPLMRFALGVVGLGLLLVLLVVGAFVGSAMLLAGMAMRLWRGRGKPTARRPQAERVVEGEYRLVGKPVLGGDKGPALPLGR